MSELTDDQLDGLFRKSAEEFEPPFDPTAWQDMKSRLDTNDRTVPGETPLWKNILRWGIVVCLLLLLLTGSFYTYRSVTQSSDSSGVAAFTVPPAYAPKSDLNQARQRLVAPTGLTPDSAKTTPDGALAPDVKEDAQPASQTMSGNDLTDAAVQPESHNPNKAAVDAVEKGTSGILTATSREKAAYGVKTDRVGTDRATIVRNRDVPSEPVTGTALDTKTAKQRTEAFITNRSVDRKQAKTRRLNRGVTSVATNDPTMIFGASTGKQPLRRDRESVSMGAVNTITNIIENTNQPNGVQAEGAGLSVVRELAIRPAHWPKALTFTSRDMVVPSQSDTVAKRVTPAPPVERGLSIRFAVAPDLSSVGLKNFSRPGTNIGVLLEYRLASRWSIQAGLIQSTKIYSASASEYNAPAGSYIETVKSKLGSVDGRCNMFDIPINLRYDFVLRPRDSGLLPSRWFISGGVTSYYIKQEDYVYNYTGYVHNAVKEWSTKTGGYGFSQLNLSVGYERALTKRLSWQIEPFMKVPLKGVGVFKIDLLSTGTFFSIRYKL